MPASLRIHPSGAHFRTNPMPGARRLTTGDGVTWRDPDGVAWSGLRVEFIYPTLGLALVRGHFGRRSIRTGGDHIESRRIKLDQLTLDRCAAERAVL